MSIALPRLRICPDCPSTRAGLLEPLVERATGCAFRCLSVEARQPFPARWRGEFSLALVRRGIIVRQRVDLQGRATAIDIAGPGSALPIGPAEDDGAAAYAVDDAMLCLCPSNVMEGAVDGGRQEARDVVRAQASMMVRIERIAEARSRATSTARVAGMLLAIADTLSPWHRLEIVPAAIQQRDLAALLALRHESVCRSLNTLTKKGVIERTVQGLRIVDRAALDAS
jgi:CRP-like cAMP-binding protein